MAVQYLRAFNAKFSPVERNEDLPGNLNLTPPYQWDRQDIFLFLSEIVRVPQHFGVVKEHYNLLEDILKNLRRISLPTVQHSENEQQFIIHGAEDFRPWLQYSTREQVDPKYAPDQHIRRSPDPAWQDYDKDSNPSQYQTQSKFILDPYQHQGIDHMTPYDLLGLFLSLGGPAPYNATDRNFFLPMTHLYAQWCKKVASNKAEAVADFKGVARPPSMYQCTWLLHYKNHDPPEYFLGASLSGYSTKKPQGKERASAARQAVGLRWEPIVQEFRYRLLPQNMLLPKYRTIDGSPLREEFPEYGTRFGQCAETYPFVYLLGRRQSQLVVQGQQYSRDFQFHGLALSSLDPDVPSEELPAKAIGPCPNCQYLVKSYLGEHALENFIPQQTQSTAPALLA